MNYYVFNIGSPRNESWWATIVSYGLIVAGFENQSGDRGDEIMNDMQENDWVVAYVNGYGYIGARRVGPATTYRLIDEAQLLSGWESRMRHVREVAWIYTIPMFSNAISPAVADRKAPRHTKERLPSDVGARIVQLIAENTDTPVPSQTLSQLNNGFEAKVLRSLHDDRSERQKRLAQANPKPERVRIVSSGFVRNPDVVAEVLDHAAGECGLCRKPAPFIRLKESRPYLEVHHRVPLAEGGDDTVLNAIALCPNRHREMHYGTKKV